MLIINLDKLKIETVYNLQTIEVLVSMKGDVKAQIEKVFADLDIHSFIDFHFCLTDIEDDADEFLSAVHTVLAWFFKYLCTSEGRQREHRMDVPSHLKGIHVSMGALKKAINYKTLVDQFNIQIVSNEYIFKLCDEKDGLEDDPNNKLEIVEEATENDNA